MRILSHPFRFEGGRFATVEQHSDEGHAEQIAVLLQTRRGERHMVPTFGIRDPAFDEVDASDVELGLELFGPPVSVREIRVEYPSDTTQEVTVIYG